MTMYYCPNITIKNPLNGYLETLIDTEATSEQVLTAGYLNALVDLGHSFTENDNLLIKYNGGASIFTMVIDDDGIITLTSMESPAGDNIIAGANGTAGYFASYSGTLDKGYLKIAATANTGDTITTITNSAMGQASIISIPDPGNAAANFVLNRTSGSLQSILNGSLQVAAGNMIAGASGAAGVLQSYPATANKGYFQFEGANSTGNTVTKFSHVAMGQATEFKLSDPALSTAYVNASSVNATGTPVGAFITKDISLTAAALASGAHIAILNAVAGMTFKVRRIFVNYGAGLSGGGGNRLVQITDGTTVYNNAGITAALLGTPINTPWGGTGNPVPGSVAANTSFINDLYAVYAGGTTDYTTGTVPITVELERVG